MSMAVEGIKQVGPGGTATDANRPAVTSRRANDGVTSRRANGGVTSRRAKGGGAVQPFTPADIISPLSAIRKWHEWQSAIAFSTHREGLSVARGNQREHQAHPLPHDWAGADGQQLLPMEKSHPAGKGEGFYQCRHQTAAAGRETGIFLEGLCVEQERGMRFFNQDQPGSRRKYNAARVPQLHTVQLH